MPKPPFQTPGIETLVSLLSDFNSPTSGNFPVKCDASVQRKTVTP